MLSRFSRLNLVAAVLLLGAAVTFSQSADNQSPIVSRPGDSRADYPKNFRETLEKLRIDKEKKEYKEMLDRGNEALKLTEELEKTVAANGKLTEREYDKIASVEKLVKKIRNDLGGNDDVDKELAKEALTSRTSPDDAVKSLHSKTSALFEELKKTTRFSISAAAIQSSNAVLRVLKFLRSAK